MLLSLFGERFRWHLLRLATVFSLVLAFVLRLWGSTRWVDLFPIGLVALLLALWLKPLVYSRLAPFLVRQAPRSVGWLAAAGGMVLAASGLAWLTAHLVAGFTFSEPLPLSIWALDLLLSLLLVPLIHARSAADDTRWAAPPLAFGIFFLGGLALVWPALAYPMTWDDLHLIRFFSADLLQATWLGNWEPDLIETPGYRPLTTAFNHFRYVLFREDVVLHRVFLVGIYAAFLAQVVAIAQRFGLGLPFSLFAGLFSFAARHSIYHYVWLADGIHAFQALLVTQAVFLLLRAIESEERAYFLYALFFSVAALLVREDNLVLLPFAFLLAMVAVFHLQPSASTRRGVLAFCAALLAMVLGYYVLRGWLVEADTLGLDFGGLLNTAKLTAFGFMGRQGFDGLSSLFVAAWPWLLAFCGLLLAGLLRSRGGWRPPAAWLAAAGLACLVGLTNDRVNLLIFSVTLFSFFLGGLFAQYAARGKLWRLSMSLLAVALLLGAAHISRTAVQAFHPSAANVIYWNTEFIYGRFAHKAYIPEARAAAVRQQLAAFGFYTADIPRTYQSSYLHLGNRDRFSQLVRQALQQGDRRPANGRFFVPLLEPFTP